MNLIFLAIRWFSFYKEWFLESTGLVRAGPLTHYFGTLILSLQNDYYWVIIVRARQWRANNNQKIQSIIGINSACFLLSGINVLRYLV
ncbi:hypothetical protein [Methylobacter sp. S3L5C]|uniref:hypothetical protein n=1 Tax=Methylobacter sp. S3L5C TaxID=2839024 RepID=UPI001FACB6B3|nr:hypothetical protein [Methylobacter sp. S3L5C]UOA07253.1 hypothetical protein KKZ03_13185 [Methylobacter sp. S3L5C]